MYVYVNRALCLVGRVFAYGSVHWDSISSLVVKDSKNGT